jgi:hypothetical protein
LASIADAERIGQERVRSEMGPKLLRRVERAARRMSDAEREYEQTVIRAARLDLAHRDIAVAAQVAPGTVRAIIARSHATSGQHAASTTIAAEPQPQLATGGRLWVRRRCGGTIVIRRHAGP